MKRSITGLATSGLYPDEQEPAIAAIVRTYDDATGMHDPKDAAEMHMTLRDIVNRTHERLTAMVEELVPQMEKEHRAEVEGEGEGEGDDLMRASLNRSGS
jgi:hypothetical protein